MPSKIEWLKDPITGKPGYTINPVKGLCPMACSYCYARRLYKRFKWNENITFNIDAFQPIAKLKPSRIFVGSTMELFGDWVRPEWMERILWFTRNLTDHTFIFLTKQPQNLVKYNFPDNCWVGVSATDKEMFDIALFWLSNIKAKVKFISFEPLLESMEINPNDLIKTVNWIIIGQQTPSSPKTQPKIEWILEIVEAADKAEIPVFIKDNLKPLIGQIVRQQFPVGVK